MRNLDLVLVLFVLTVLSLALCRRVMAAPSLVVQVTRDPETRAREALRR